MAKHSYEDNTIQCMCGICFEAKLEDALSDHLWEDSFDNSLQETANYTCPNCKAEYSLTIQVEKTVKVTYHDLSFNGQTTLDIDGDDFNLSQLGDLFIGESIPLPDGSVVAGDREYIIDNQTIVNYFATPDENQITLEECMA